MTQTLFCLNRMGLKAQKHYHLSNGTVSQEKIFSIAVINETSFPSLSEEYV